MLAAYANMDQRVRVLGYSLKRMAKVYCYTSDIYLAWFLYQVRIGLMSVRISMVRRSGE